MPVRISYSGNTSDKILIFLHGWPDDETLWHPLVQILKEKYLCITVTLPGFGETELNQMDIPLLCENLRRVIAEAKAGRPEAKVTLVAHDWGAYLSYLLEFRFPGLVERIVALDVGGEIRPSSIGHAIFLVGYQWYLITAWLIGRISSPLGNLMSRKMAKVLGAPHPELVKSSMNYLYFMLWKALLCGHKHIRLPGRHSPKVPTLFLFGGKKRYMFHTTAWIERLKSNPPSNALEISAGHWLTRDNPKSTYETIQLWLVQTD